MAGRLLPAAQDERPQERTLIARKPLKGAPGGPGPSVIGLFGPTASGKTAVGQALAERIRAELVAADSMQVYRGLPLLTNQDAGVRLAGIWPLDRQGTVGEFQQLAHEAIDEIVAAGQTAVVVGGSGLWFQAALTGVELPADVPSGARARWERLYDRRGAATAHALLERCDPRAAARVHPNDRKRVGRALELQRGGLPPPERSRELWSSGLRRPTILIGLVCDRELLADRIGRRVEAMAAAGAGEEARRAITAAPSRTARAALGLQAFASDDLDAVKAAHRRYARRQMTWLRKTPGIELIDTSELAAAQAAERIGALLGDTAAR